jgi:hypothetical protein
MAAPESRPPVESFASPSAYPPRTIAQSIVGISVLLLGAALLVSGVVGIFVIHINGVGRLLGCGIVLGLGMVLHGWTLLTGSKADNTRR